MPNANRFGDLRRSTLSWCRRTRISASNAARDLNRPIKAHQINLQRSPIGSEYQPIRGRSQRFWVCGRDRFLEREHHQWKSKAPPRYPVKHALRRQDGVRSTLISKGPRHRISPTSGSAAGQMGSRRCTRVAYCHGGAMAGSTGDADAPRWKAIARGSTAAAPVERTDTLWAMWRRLHHEIERPAWLRCPS